MDLDGDGALDVVSGSWPGEIYFFKGGPRGQFADGVKLKDRDGKSINPAGGLKKTDSSISVAGDATFEKDADGNSVLVYEGERHPIPKGMEAYITGAASAVYAVDWTGDGLPDLLVGEIGGHVHLVPNEGTRTAPVFGKGVVLQADGKDIRVDGGDAGPTVADWDGDGVPDLIVGAGDGSVWWYRNIGTAKQPKLAAGVSLVAEGKVEYGPNAPKEPTRGSRAKVHAVDVNGDGRLDLLLGDFATQKPDLPEPTPEQKAEHDKLRKERDDLQKQLREIQSKLFGSNAVKGEDEKKAAAKSYEERLEKLRAVMEKLPPEYENHGWIWYFERKPK